MADKARDQMEKSRADRKKKIKSGPVVKEFKIPSHTAKDRHFEKNKRQHEANLLFVRELGIQPEKTEREVHKLVKRGNKTTEITIAVVKDKRPSKLLRKWKRRKLVQRMSQIDRLATMVNSTEPLTMPNQGKITKKPVGKES